MDELELSSEDLHILIMHYIQEGIDNITHIIDVLNRIKEIVHRRKRVFGVEECGSSSSDNDSEDDDDFENMNLQADIEKCLKKLQLILNFNDKKRSENYGEQEDSLPDIKHAKRPENADKRKKESSKPTKKRSKKQNQNSPKSKTKSNRKSGNDDLAQNGSKANKTQKKQFVEKAGESSKTSTLDLKCHENEKKDFMGIHNIQLPIIKLKNILADSSVYSDELASHFKEQELLLAKLQKTAAFFRDAPLKLSSNNKSSAASNVIPKKMDEEMDETSDIKNKDDENITEVPAKAEGAVEKETEKPKQDEKQESILKDENIAEVTAKAEGAVEKETEKPKQDEKQESILKASKGIKKNKKRKNNGRKNQVVEEREKKSIRFNERVEVKKADNYDRKNDKPWTTLTDKDKVAIKKELNAYKLNEMKVHEESKQFTSVQ